MLRFECRGPSVAKPVLPRVRVCNSYTNRGIVAVINEGKDIEKHDIGAKGKNIIGKRNNKDKGKPFLNYNG